MKSRDIYIISIYLDLKYLNFSTFHFMTTERNLNRVLTSVRNVAGCMSDGEVVLSPPPPHDRSWLASTCHRTTTQYTLKCC